MPTTRRTARIIDADDGDPTAFDTPSAADFESVDAAPSSKDVTDRRTDALAALVQQAPRTISSDLTPPPQPRTVPVPTGVTVEWSNGTRRLMVWSTRFARMDGDERRSARRGDIVIVPDDEWTQQQNIDPGYLIEVPE